MMIGACLSRTYINVLLKIGRFWNNLGPLKVLFQVHNGALII